MSFCQERNLNSVAVILKYFFAFILVLSGFPSSLSSAAEPGGSNYGWYKVDGITCDREAYGVIANYDTAAAIIKQQLATMHANSQ